jgi:uncharacterized RDD family membrane protein YckC
VQDPTAVVGRRIVAYIIDSVVITAIFAGLFLALGSDGTDFDSDAIDRATETFGFNDISEGFNFKWDLANQVGGYINVDLNDADGGDAKLVEGTEFWIVTLVGLGASLALLVLMQGATGRTPGKAVMGIRTVGANGQPPGIGKAAVRWILLFVDSFCLLPGLISMLASKGHRRIGDMAAGTYVVSAAAAGQPVAVGGAAPAMGYAQSTVAAPAQPSADAQWDPNRQAWIRWDGNSWSQHDPNVPGGWRPIS